MKIILLAIFVSLSGSGLVYAANVSNETIIVEGENSSASSDKENQEDSDEGSSESRGTSAVIHHSSVGIGIGETFLYGSFGKNGDDRVTFDLLYSYAASYTFDFFADFHYSSHTIRQTKVVLPGMALSIKGRFFQMDAFSPYAIGGLGFYRPVEHRLVGANVEKSEGKLAFGLNAGVGVDLRLNKRVIVGILFQLHDPFDVQQDAGAKVEGYYSKLMMTAMYTF